MQQWSLASLIAALEETLVATVKAVSAFLRFLRPKLPEIAATPFGEYERVEESKYYLPEPRRVVTPAPEELPGFYGRTRLVMLVVDPYTVHAYWEVAPDQLNRAEKKMRGPYRAVLRFYEIRNGGTGYPAGRFDVDVDLQPHNWYVHLWSPDQACDTALGLKSGNGQFMPLARSNPIRTPRAWPAEEAEHAFVPAEPARFSKAASPTPPRELVRARAGTEFVEAGGGCFKPFDSGETLKKKLVELGTFRGALPEPPRMPEPVMEVTPAAPGRGPRTDLAGIAESQFAPGVSSQTMWRTGPED